MPSIKIEFPVRGNLEVDFLLSGPGPTKLRSFLRFATGVSSPAGMDGKSSPGRRFETRSLEEPR